MKKLFSLIVLFTFIIFSIFSEESVKEILNYFDSDFISHGKEQLQSQIEDGVVYELLVSSYADKAVRIYLYSPHGRTEYTCLYIKKGKIWYLQKKSIIYDEPYKTTNAEEFITYFKFDTKISKLVNQEFIEGLDVSTAPAVVDFRNAHSLIEMIEEEILKE